MGHPGSCSRGEAWEEYARGAYEGALRNGGLDHSDPRCCDSSARLALGQATEG
jgi:hypothetical protein